jgi:stage II sporulation protein D
MKEQPTIQVGILYAKSVRFTLKGDYRIESSGEIVRGNVQVNLEDSRIQIIVNGIAHETLDSLIFHPVDYNTASFELSDVTIGINFHWERKENQLFKGSLRIIEEQGTLTAINELLLEDYLESVISSEMKATASQEFLKAHAVISRSWLLAQIAKADSMRLRKPYNSFINTKDEHIRWYDREDHSSFDVCADDHCQRYQGITKASMPEVKAAVVSTSGLVLQFDGEICDARFSKCCGGITELFENAWEPVSHPYLSRIVDNDSLPDGHSPDLKVETAASQWITSSPPAYCNTSDAHILSQVLNDYDMETPDFYRWSVEISQQKLQYLLKEKIGFEPGNILDMYAVKRGESGRITKLKIEGSVLSKVIGKELEIRKALSDSHLYSSAFVVEKCNVADGVPQSFKIHGAGWGHGVGLCQIGAAVMGAKGSSFEEILMHYFRGAGLVRRY